VNYGESGLKQAGRATAAWFPGQVMGITPPLFVCGFALRWLPKEFSRRLSDGAR